MKIVDKDKRYIYIYFVVLTIALAVGFQGWRTLLNNYAVNIVHFNGLHIGILQSLREIPGLLSLIVIYLLLIFSEKKLAALSVVILGLAISLTGFFPTVYGLIFTTIIMSFGFHYFQVVFQSVSIKTFSITELPHVLGKYRSWSAITNIIVGVFILLVAIHLKYRTSYLIIGVIPLIIGLVLLTDKKVFKEKGYKSKRMVFKKRYWLFYVLNFFSGARRQMFVAFAIFLLVEKFHYSLFAIALLFILNNVINYFFNNKIGSIINKFGERKVLTLSYISIIIIFAVYAFSNSAILVGVMYVFDNIFFNCNIAIKTFFQKIAKKEDVSSSMAVSFTINHIMAVLVPVIGGLIWIYDYRIVFVLAIFITIIALVYIQFIDKEVLKGIEA